MNEPNVIEQSQDVAAGCAPATGSEARPLTLTMEEIRHLAQFCGMVITEPTPQEKEDERETEVVIAPWPIKGVKGDDGMLPPHRHIAYLDEYPEEGCVPLGSPNE
jgi:hypothetical protein